MTKKCIYCSQEISEDFAVDFCVSCGKKVWGEKLFYMIVKNIEDAKERGDLS